MIPPDIQPILDAMPASDLKRAYMGILMSDSPRDAAGKKWLVNRFSPKPAVPRIELPQPSPSKEIGQPGPRGASVDRIVGATGDYLDGAETKTAKGPSDCSDLWASKAAEDDPKPARVTRDAGEED